MDAEAGPAVRVEPDVETKMDRLATDAYLDRGEGDEKISRRPVSGEGRNPQVPAPSAPAPKRLFKVLQSNECALDCGFCPWRAGRDVPRTTLEPEELAGAFHAAHAAGYAEGLYLTSGIRGDSVSSMDAMLKTADLLRGRYLYEGPLHLKVLPGAQRAQVQEAMRLADGLSLNLEAPTETSLQKLTGQKHLEADLLERLRWVHELRAEFPLSMGLTTQFVIGPAGESDRDLLTRVDGLYREFEVRKAFYSAFQPFPDTPLESAPPTPKARGNRLYQADLLMRRYGIALEEMAYSSSGHLALGADPKLYGALHHPERFPVEVNTASYEELLRVPGVGPLTAKRLLSRRRERLIRDPREVALCGGVLKRAAPFLLLNGRSLGHLEQFIRQELRRLSTPPAFQLPLFDPSHLES